MVTAPHTHNIHSPSSSCRTVHIAGQASVTLHEHRVFVQQTTVRVGDKMQYKIFVVPAAALDAATKSTSGGVSLLCKVIEATAYCATAIGRMQPSNSDLATAHQLLHTSQGQRQDKWPNTSQHEGKLIGCSEEPCCTICTMASL
ncbi:hypothetical protein TRVL_07197 [Trypanosoma vivax]|nr:hypothetical protein TRVL_07197 [Trypanosoma vivax]